MTDSFEEILREDYTELLRWKNELLQMNADLVEEIWDLKATILQYSLERADSE